MKFGRIAARVLDQLVFGATSIVSLLAVNVCSSVRDAGALSLLLMIYILGSVVAQGAFVDPAITSKDFESPGAQSRMRAFGRTWGVILSPGAFAIALGVHLPMATAAMFAACLPFAMDQYVARGAALSAGSVTLPLTSDAAWLLTLVVPILLFGEAAGSLSGVVLLWSVGSVLASLAFGWRTRSAPLRRLAETASEIVRNRQSAAELLVGQGAAQLIVLALGLLGGLVAVGVLRTAQSLMSPLLLLAAAGRHLLLPFLVRVREDVGAMRRVADGAAVAGPALGALLACVVLGAGEAGAGTFLGGHSTQILNTSAVLALGTGVALAAVCWSLQLRALQEFREALTIRLGAASASVLLALTAQTLWQSPVATAWGLVIAELGAGVAWYVRVRHRLV